MLSVTIAPSSRKDNEDGSSHPPLVFELGRLGVNSFFLICVGVVLITFFTGSSVKDDGGRSPIRVTTRDDWCSTMECQQRMESLRTKLELEAQSYQEKLRVAIASATGCDPDQEDRQCSMPMTQGINSNDDKMNFDKEEIIESRLYQMYEGDNVESLPQYRVKPEWRVKADGTGGSFPSLNVVGQIKTGTSQLYNLFATHEDVLHVVDKYGKEHCSVHHHGKESPNQDLYEYVMFQWHDYYYRQKTSTSLSSQASPQHQVNGCLDIPDLERRYAYNPPAKDTKFFFLLRDPADWAWAAYNFFCDQSSENFHPDDNWVNASIHYRSPEAFHELVLSGKKSKGAARTFKLRDNSVLELRRLRALVGDENLIVLKNEDLEPHHIQQDRDGKGTSTLDYLAGRTGLSKTGFDKEVLESRSNCNANKGYGSRCHDNVDRSKGVGYSVTNGRPMLESTRKFIYVQWYETCKIWAEEFGVFYPRCLSVLDEYL